MSDDELAEEYLRGIADDLEAAVCDCVYRGEAEDLLAACKALRAERDAWRELAEARGELNACAFNVEPPPKELLARIHSLKERLGQ